MHKRKIVKIMGKHRPKTLQRMHVIQFLEMDALFAFKRKTIFDKENNGLILIFYTL